MTISLEPSLQQQVWCYSLQIQFSFGDCAGLEKHMQQSRDTDQFGITQTCAEM